MNEDVAIEINLYPRTILLIDDDQLFVTSLRNYLLEKHKNHSIKIIHNGFQALEILEKEKIKLALLDIHMPEMDGFQLLAELENRNIWLPILILTEFIQDEIIERGEFFSRFGVLDFLEKPVNLDELDKKMEEVLLHSEERIFSCAFPEFLEILQEADGMRKSGVITIQMEEKTGRLFLRKGRIIDCAVQGLSAHESLQEVLLSLQEKREIWMLSIDHTRGERIMMGPSEILREQNRLQSLKFSPGGVEDSRIQTAMGKEKDADVTVISEILNQQKEIESFVIFDRDETVLVSSGESNENLVKMSNYCFFIGEHTGSELKFGSPYFFEFNLISKKHLVFKQNQFLIVLTIKTVVKTAEFKKKMEELLSKTLIPLNQS